VPEFDLGAALEVAGEQPDSDVGPETERVEHGRHTGEHAVRVRDRPADLRRQTVAVRLAQPQHVRLGRLVADRAKRVQNDRAIRTPSEGDPLERVGPPVQALERQIHAAQMGRQHVDQAPAIPVTMRQIAQQSQREPLAFVYEDVRIDNYEKPRR